jgi:hypothetical protein
MQEGPFSPPAGVGARRNAPLEVVSGVFQILMLQIDNLRGLCNMNPFPGYVTLHRDSGTRWKVLVRTSVFVSVGRPFR